jgi:hypothetical protein
MTLHELFWFLLGDAEAIRTLASNVWSPAVGAMLVVSAGLARNYDTRDVRRQWWRLLVPFAASTLAAALLVLVVFLFTGAAGMSIALARGFLGLFWLTAPLAWLYGIPYERLWSPAAAARNRRVALGMVALCRVVLMTQAVRVLCGCNGVQAFVVVFCFAVPTAVLAVGAALALVRRPEAAPTLRTSPAVEESSGAAAVRVVIDEMSGRSLAVDARSGDIVGVAVTDRSAEAPRPPHGTPKFEPAGTESVGKALGGCGALLLVLSSLGLLMLLPRWDGVWLPVALESDYTPPSPELWAFAAGAVLIWSIALFVRQPAQRRRTLFAERLRFGHLLDTIRDLARYRAEHFPPGWDPSAALARRDDAKRLLDACGIAAALPTDSWVRSRFLERLGSALPLWTEWFDFEVVAKDGHLAQPWLDPARLHELTQLRELLCSLPEGPEIVEPYQEYLASLWASAEKRDPPRADVIRDIYLLAAKRGDRR